MHSLDKEFQYSDKNFQFIKHKVKQLAGIHLPDTKNELVYSRISRLLRQYHLKSFDEYCECLNQNNDQFLKEFVNAITTNYTLFMREAHQFEFLRTTILPEIERLKAREMRLRIWSAGCSTGEEAYSISFVVNDYFGTKSPWDIKILASDIDSDVLERGRASLYPQETIDDLPNPYQLNKNHYFEVYDPFNHIYKVKDVFRNLIYFKPFNLMTKDDWPMHGPFDVIFCRNVMIYFDKISQYHTISKFLELLPINGYLILGHSESVPLEMQQHLKFIDSAIYRRYR